ncbi:hypothetical protein [Streptomyces albidoflavus]|uniref:hypothetical protein n=1 Tax=Streptomyces albidoflavus TaxID=1886 RepID=UPI00188B1539|nr:hypothetical protein [Streptomyces albidoflavus]MBF4136708.1 hypothetical protein [Streptomyces albidoflavus]
MSVSQEEILAKIACVLYPDPVTGLPPKCARTSLPVLDGYPGGLAEGHADPRGITSSSTPAASPERAPRRTRRENRRQQRAEPHPNNRPVNSGLNV